MAGVAVSVTCVPAGKSYEQVEGQLIPAGLDVTLPEPVPFVVTVSVYVTSAAEPATECAAALLGPRTTASGARRRTRRLRRHDNIMTRSKDAPV